MGHRDISGCRQRTSDRSHESLPAVGEAGGCSGGLQRGEGEVPRRPDSGPRIVDCGVEPWLGLFTQLWGSPGPGEREDVFRVSLIMAASEEINRQGPAGMLQPLPLVWGEGECTACGETRGRPELGGDEQRRRRTHTPGGYAITLALWFHICAAARACKSTFLVWPDASEAPRASARTWSHFLRSHF